MSQLEDRIMSLQPLQISLMTEYVEVWENWLDNNNDELLEQLEKIKNKIDHLTMGMQLSALIEKIRLEQSGLVIPGNFK